MTSSVSRLPREVFIVAACRTPMGNAGGLLSGMAATEMGGAAISEAMRRSGIPANRVDECVMGIALPGVADRRLLGRQRPLVDCQIHAAAGK